MSQRSAAASARSWSRAATAVIATPSTSRDGMTTAGPAMREAASNPILNMEPFQQSPRRQPRTRLGGSGRGARRLAPVYGIALSVSACLRAGTRVDVAWAVDTGGFDGHDRTEALAITP